MRTNWKLRRTQIGKKSSEKKRKWKQRRRMVGKTTIQTQYLPQRFDIAANDLQSNTHINCLFPYISTFFYSNFPSILEWNVSFSISLELSFVFVALGMKNFLIQNMNSLTTIPAKYEVWSEKNYPNKLWKELKRNCKTRTTVTI